MANDAELKVGITAEDNATADMRKVATEVANLTDQMSLLAKQAQRAAKSGNALEKSLVGAGKGTKQAATGLKAQLEQMRAVSREEFTLAKRGTSGNDMATRYHFVAQRAKEARDAVAALNLVQKPSGKLYNTEDKRWANKSEVAAYADALKRVVGIEEQLTKLRARSGGSMTAATPTGTTAYASKVAQANNVVAESAEKTSKSMQDLNQHLFTSRFAYYDIAAATGVAGAALIAMNAAAVHASATYESAMASIQRTTGTSNAALETLRSDFIGLAQTIPGGFDNLAKIGELAGQLNIPEDRIASFSETVAKFVSSTDVSVQSATEAFGRLDALLPGVAGNYEALGSSILNVGVNSVATESAIISTATQIAAAGQQAGMTADEIIGLSAAYASLGVAPEAARGTTVRVFGEIGKAVAEGGEKLDKFAKVAQVSSSAFASAFQNSGTEALMLLLNGLAQNSENAQLALADLGITGVRDIKALLGLSQNMEIVNQSFGYAADGFENADALAKAFGITSTTLNSKLEIMAQSFQAFLAEMGEGNLVPLKAFVDAINGLLVVLTEAAGNPVAQWVAAFTALITLVAGGVLIFTAVAARMAAFRASVLLTKIQLDAMSTSTTVANQRLIALRTTALTAATNLATLRGALTALARSTVVIGAVMAIAGIGMSTWERNFKSATDIAKDAGADFGLLRKALEEDTAAAEDGAHVYKTLEGTLTTVQSTTAGWVTQVERATGASVAATSATEDQISKTDELTLSLGKNTKAALAAQLANSQSFQSFVKNLGEYTKSGRYGSGLQLKGIVTKLTEGDIEGARKLYEGWKVEQNALLAFSTDPAGRINFQNTVNDLDASFKEMEGSIAGATAFTEALGVVSSATGINMEALGGSLDESASDADSAADKFSTLQTAIATAFAPMSVLVNWTAAAQQLFSGLTETGVTGFYAMGEAGATNLSNLTNAIATTIAAGASMGVDTTQSVAALFLSLQKMGIDTAQLLAAVANVPGVDTNALNGYLAGTLQMSDSGSYLASVMDQLAGSAGAASTGVGGVGDSAKDASEALEEASVSAAQFASTLGQIADRANDIRYGVQSAKDAVYTMLNTMKQEAADAYDNIEKLNREIGELQGENSNLDYALQVAIDYGDDMRAAEIRAQQAKNATEIADKSGQATEEQDKLSKSTEGTTQAAVDNRAALLELSAGYQDQIEAYAATGASQAEVEAYAKKLYKQYTREAEALGYSTDSVKKYGLGILDMAKIARGVPKTAVTNIAIKGLDPAKAALKEFEAQAQKSARAASDSIRSGGGGGWSVPPIDLGLKPPTPEKAREWGDTTKLRIERGMPPVGVPLSSGQARAQGWGAAFASGLKEYLDKKRIRTAPGTKVEFNTDGTLKEGSVGRFKFYKTGGFTGPGSKHNLAGMVHGKEYVINEENTSRLGIPFLDALNSGKTPVAPVASRGLQVVELSSRDRALLAATGNVTLTIDGKVVGQATNAANFGAGKRGSN